MTREFTFTLLSSALGGTFSSDLDGAAAAECINFKSENGVLVDGSEVGYYTENGKRLPLPEGEPTGLFFGNTEAGEKLLAAVKDKDGNTKIYATPLGENAQFSAISGTLSGRLMFVNVDLYGERNVVYADSQGKLYAYNGTTASEHSCPEGGVALVSFNGRLALITPSKAYLSSPVSMFSFSEYGSVSMGLPGGFSAVSAVVYGGELLIAGVRGLVRIAQNMEDNFVIKTISTGGELLYPETLAVGMEKAFVMSDSGLCSFDGLELTFSYPEAAQFIQGGVYAFAWGNRYTAVVKAADIAQKRLVLSFENGKVEMSDIPINAVAMPLFYSRPMTVMSGCSYVLTFSGPPARPGARRIYRTARTDFGITGKKTLVSFSILTNKAITAVIEADGKRRTFKIPGGRTRRKVMPYMSGEVFSLSLVAEGSGVSISAPSFTVEYM